VAGCTIQFADAPEAIPCLGTGTYVILPPSLHPAGGSFTWRLGHSPEERNAAVAPPWLVDFLLAENKSIIPGPWSVATKQAETTAALAEAESDAPQGPPTTDPELTPHLILLSDVKPATTHWLWPGRVPLGKLTVLDGDPGLGKSTLLLDIAARVTTHGVHFNDKQGPTGTVILLSAEDGPEDTIKPRLEAAGANPEMIIDLSDIVVGDKQRPPEIPADLELIESVIKEHRAKLVIIEPLAAFLAGPDANKDQEIRRVLYKLSKIAERNACTIIVLRHLNKSGGGKAIYRGNMSIGVIGHA
jgi:hypothetical protein